MIMKNNNKIIKHYPTLHFTIFLFPCESTSCGKLKKVKTFIFSFKNMNFTDHLYCVFQLL